MAQELFPAGGRGEWHPRPDSESQPPTGGQLFLSVTSGLMPVHHFTSTIFLL